MTDTPSKILDRAMLSACAEAGYVPVSDLVEYDASTDFANSIDAAYSAIRARVAAGGPGWRGPRR